MLKKIVGLGLVCLFLVISVYSNINGTQRLQRLEVVV